MTDSPTLHIRQFPINGLVPMHGALRRIHSAQRDGEWWNYRLDDGTTVTHQRIIDSITASAQYQLKQEVMMGANGWRTVVNRRWNFKRGMAFYRVADRRRNVASGWVSEEQMNDFRKWWAAVLGNPPDAEQLLDQDLQSLM